MSKNQRTAHRGQRSTNQNNIMSEEDPGDGNRTAFKPGRDGKTPVEKKPEQDRHDQETIEAFGEQGSDQASENPDNG